MVLTLFQKRLGVGAGLSGYTVPFLSILVEQCREPLDEIRALIIQIRRLLRIVFQIVELPLRLTGTRLDEDGLGKTA